MSGRGKLIREIRLMLGDGIIDLELEEEHYNMAIDKALSRYRYRSQNALEEAFLFLDVQPDVQVYTLPREVKEVINVYRRTTGNAGGALDPFSLTYANSFYTVMSSTGLNGGTGLATYELAMQAQELMGRMFGRDIKFLWNMVTHKITFERRFLATEQILLHIYNERPEEALFQDDFASNWLRDYAIAVCKQIMGEARSKFASLAGPQGGVTLNGDALKSEAATDFERLENEIANWMDGRDGMPFTIG